MGAQPKPRSGEVRICLRHRYDGLCRTTFVACSMQVVCLHIHGIRPAAASTHPHADASANRPSYRRKDGVVTHTFSRFLVVPRRVSLLHCLDDYLAAGALNSRECLNNLSSIMSLPWGFLWPWCKSNFRSFRPQHSSLPPRHQA